MMTTTTTQAPDWLPVYATNGEIKCYRPNYDKPGVAECVARDVEAAYVEAHPATSSIGLHLQAARTTRFEARMAREFGGAQ